MSQRPKELPIFQEVEGGYFDSNGFYRNPDGSYWDDQFTFFDSNGFDANGGYYDEYGIYKGSAGNTEQEKFEEEEMFIEADPFQEQTEYIEELKQEYERFKAANNFLHDIEE